MRPTWVFDSLAALLLVMGIGPWACKSTQISPPAANSSVVASTATCADCHKGQARMWRDGGHHSLSCEACHGFGSAHAMATTRPGQPRPTMPGTNGASACLKCHQQLKSFAEHVKAVETKHVMKVNLERAQGQCVYCHDPHSLQ